MTISDERLAELVEQSVYGRFTDSRFEDDASAALRELQAARELLATLAAQWSGEIGGTKRSDCMAVLARVHLRNHGQAHERTDYCCVHGIRLFDDCGQCETAHPTDPRQS